MIASPEPAIGEPPPSEVRPPRTRPRRLSEWGPAAAVLLLGLLLSLAVFMAIRGRERAARRIEFERRAARVALAAQASFDVPLEVLCAIPSLFDASEDVTRAEFRAFVRHPLARYPWIYALEWIPRVPGMERAKFEAAAVADGLPGFHFKQDAPAGSPVRADERPEYFPLYYMEPPNAVALGIEETALGARKAALERARDLDTTVVTERLRLVQDDPSVGSVIAFHPVYRHGELPQTVTARRERLAGLAAVVFRIQPVVVAALGAEDLDQLDVVLADVDAEPETLLYESRRGARAARAAGTELVFEQRPTIGGRHWAIRVGDRAGWVEARSAGWIALGIGWLASAFAAAFVHAGLSVLRLRRQVRAAKRLGQYTLVEKLGEGGMGTVYRAHHALLRRPTAIKLLLPTRHDATALARFESEVQLTSSLTHPNTVVVYDYGRSPDGTFYYAMEYVDGITLQDLVDIDGPQLPARVVHVMLQICAALAEAHAIGLVHRDVKPANVMLCQRGGMADFVKVLDFGLAKDLSGGANSKLSQSTALLGTPLYIAPEVILGRPIDARLDIYALGGVAYFMLTGTPVFSGETLLDVCVQHLTAPPEAPSLRLGQDLPFALEALVVKCLAKEPAQRPGSVNELGAALRALAIPAWGTEEADRWWSEKGRAVAQRVQAARRTAEREPSGQTLEVEQSGRSPAVRTPTLREPS
jgi:CHASE1-domain containing sensor protein